MLGWIAGVYVPAASPRRSHVKQWNQCWAGRCPRGGLGGVPAGGGPRAGVSGGRAARGGAAGIGGRDGRRAHGAGDRAVLRAMANITAGRGSFEEVMAALGSPVGGQGSRGDLARSEGSAAGPSGRVVIDLTASDEDEEPPGAGGADPEGCACCGLPYPDKNKLKLRVALPPGAADPNGTRVCMK